MYRHAARIAASLIPLWGLGCTPDPGLRPLANAGPDVVIMPGEPAALDGSGSEDVDGGIDRYQWTLLTTPADSQPSLSNSDTAFPILSADLPGDYTLALTVWDDQGNRGVPDVAVVRAVMANQSPVAVLSLSGDVGEGLALSLDGSASSDPDGDSLTYAFSVQMAPAGAEATIQTEGGASATLTPDRQGTWVVGLAVSDGRTWSRREDVLVVVGEIINTAPLARCGSDLAVETGASVTLDGSASADPEGSGLGFAWSLAVPDGSDAALTDATTDSPSFTTDIDGVYVGTLVVNDGVLDSDPCTQTVSASGIAVNSPPVADAGPDSVHSEPGEWAELDGSGSFDPDGDELTYAWSFLELPGESALEAGDLFSSDDVEASFQPDVGGIYWVQLKVCDPSLECDQDELTVDVGDPNQAPSCDAGGDLAANADDTVTLDGSASSDPDGDSLSWAWSLDSAPSGSTAALSDLTASAPTFTPDLGGTYSFSMEVSDGALSCTDTVSLSVSDPNTAPTCDAGADQTVLVGETVTVDASGSSDPDGDVLSYTWTFTRRPTGSVATLTSASAAAPSFEADVAGDYELSLTVSDGTDTCADAVVVRAEARNTAPSCDAGGDLAVTTGDTAVLDGSASSDADGDSLTWSWTLDSAPAGSAAALSDAATDTATLTTDLEGSYAVTLVVSDGSDSCSETVRVVATDPNTPPDCDAGSDQAVSTGDTASVDASASSDADGDALSYLWTLYSAPTGSAAVLSGASTQTATFDADLEGDYTLTVLVSDGTDTCTDSITVTATPANTPPTCTAGADQTALVGDTVTLDASGATDADGDSLIFYWGLAAKPSGSSVSITTPSSSVATLVPDVAGTYKINLWVYDGIENCFDRMVITVTGPNLAPTADAGDDVQLCAPETVTLDGSGSSDPNGDRLTYAWTFSSLPAASALTDSDISGAATATPSFEPDVGGDYELQLEVDDGTDTDTDTVAVYVDGDGMVMLLHLDETSGSTASDSSGAGNDATTSGTSFGGGRFFGALELDGSGAANVTHDGSLDLSDAFTIDWWMRTDSVSSAYQVVLMKGYPYNYSAWTLGDQVLFYGLQTDGSYAYVAADAALGDGSWHHYAITLDGGTLTLYEDGTAIGSRSTTADLVPNTKDLRIGRPAWSTSAYWFTGALDEITIRDEALSASELAELASDVTQVCTGDQDTDAPVAAVSSPTDGSTTDQQYLVVEGTASDDSAITSVTIGDADAVATSASFATWVAYVSLDEGDNTLTVSVSDIAGNTNSAADSLVVTLASDDCTAGLGLLLGFDEASSGAAIDQSAYALDASDSGTARAIGAFGNSAVFDGSSITTVPSDPVFDLTAPFSIDLWVLRDGASATHEPLVVHGTNLSYGLLIYGDYVVFTITDSAGSADVLAATGVVDGDWHHVAATFDSVELALYVDGVLADTTPLTVTPDTTSAGLDIGALSSGLYAFEGQLDQVRFTTFALSDTEVADLYAGGEACAVSDNLALSGTATASSTYGPLYSASNIIDGLTDEYAPTDTTMWLLPDSSTGWVQVDLGAPVGITMVRWANTHNNVSYDRATAAYEMAASTTGAFTGEETTLSSGVGDLESELVFHTTSPTAPVPGRYLRFYVDGYHNNGGGLNELQIFGVE